MKLHAYLLPEFVIRAIVKTGETLTVFYTGIENPRVLGSIPSPGTIFKETSLIAGFLLSGIWTLHQTRFDY
ncbi:hypothetical protein, partial [Yersinia massiliensis]|uniref:hypothetical protein n=1 Tax=Yersinia massiliensis TaxID=419257 RepID=UPI001C945A66